MDQGGGQEHPGAEAQQDRGHEGPARRLAMVGGHKVGLKPEREEAGERFN